MHNAKVANFDAVISKAKKCIERHYIQEQIEQLQYNDKEVILQQFKDNLKKQKKNVIKRKQNMQH